jgi:hypothetical protein
LSSNFESNWQLKGGHFSQKRKFCVLLAISYHRRDLFIIQCTDKPHLVFPVGARRKTAEILSVGYHYFFFGAYLAQPVQLGCTADFERFWPILGPKFDRISCFLVSRSPLDIVKISGHCDKTVRARLGGIPPRFAYAMANKGGFSEVTPL